MRNTFNQFATLCGRPLISMLALVFALDATATTGSKAAEQPAATPSAAVGPLRPPAASAKNGVRWTGAAKVLAGMKVPATHELAEFSNRKSVVQHRVEFDRAWGKFANDRLKPVGAFAATELNGPAAAGPLYYPFSGPDILYALALFPQATEYVLTGLEPVGDVPDLSKLDEEQTIGSLAQLRRSLNAMLAFSFFKTNDMREEFANNKLSGVTPILLIFLARNQATIGAVEPFVLEKDGNLRLTTTWSHYNLPSGRIPGVRITFAVPGESRERKLYYFTADISDSGLATTPQYLNWMQAYEPQVTFIKSASYLMHKSYFSRVRSFILDRSNMVLQDDSGIPLRLFPEQAWERKMYGAYAGPIPLFSNWYQPEMKTAYDKAAMPIDFGIGYQHVSKRSNLQIFVRRAPRSTS